VVPIVPSRGWALAQQAVLPLEDSGFSPQPSLLGLSMRMCEFESATDNVWHVLEVMEGSPAESAGLVPYGDWIIGWSGGVLSAENDFYDVVEAVRCPQLCRHIFSPPPFQHVDKPLRVYVYSYDFEYAFLKFDLPIETHDTFSNLREVVLVPNRHWGGEGLLGCIFGCVLIHHFTTTEKNVTSFRFGYLHRIPSQPTDRKVLGALHEHSDLKDQRQLFVPADVSPNTAPSGFVTGDHGYSPRHSSPMVAHPHPTRPGEMTRRAADPLGRDIRSTSRPSTPRRSTQTPSSHSPVTSRSFGSTLNGDSSPRS